MILKVMSITRSIVKMTWGWIRSKEVKMERIITKCQTYWKMQMSTQLKNNLRKYLINYQLIINQKIIVNSIINLDKLQVHNNKNNKIF